MKEKFRDLNLDRGSNMYQIRKKNLRAVEKFLSEVHLRAIIYGVNSLYLYLKS